MMRWTRTRIVASAVIVAAAGCGFPSVAFDDAGPADGEAVMTSDAPASSDADHDASAGDATATDVSSSSVDGGPERDGTIADGTVESDGASARDGTAGDATIADATNTDASPVDATTADVEDARGPDAANDGAVDAGVNCDCGAGAMFPTHVTCTGTLGTSGLLCTAKSGFSDNGPPCGQASASFVTCPSDLEITCVGTTSTVVQRCLP